MKGDSKETLRRIEAEFTRMRRQGQRVKKQTVEKSDPVADRFMKMLLAAKEPDVEIEPTTIKKPVPLQIQAKPILANIGTVTAHKKKIMSWEIEEPTESADSLIETAMVSLGFKKPKPKLTMDSLKCNIMLPKKKSIWSKKIF